MGCGCGGKGSKQPFNLNPTKILTLSELRNKVEGRKSTQSQIVKKTISTPKIIDQPVIIKTIFKVILEKFNTNQNYPKKTIILITNNGSVESRYLRNLLNKFAVINNNYKEAFDFIEVNYTYLIDTEEFTKFPTTLFINKNKLFKKQIGIFDVKRALEEFFRLT